MGDIAAVCTASSNFSSLNVIPPLHMGSLHPAVVFIITAVFFICFVLFLWLYLTALNCCSPGCFSNVLFLKCERGGRSCGSDVNRSRRCEVSAPTKHLHLLLCLLENKRGSLFYFLFKARFKNMMFKCHRQFMGKEDGGRGGGREVTESVLKKDNHYLGKNKQILIQIYLLPLEIKKCLCFSFMFFFRCSHF